VHPKMSPGSYKPIVAYQGAGPGEPDSALCLDTGKFPRRGRSHFFVMGAEPFFFLDGGGVCYSSRGGAC